MKKLRIVGAGLSGLLCAHYALKKGHQVEVFEASSRVGGKLQTFQGAHGLFETAANAILADLEVERVANEIGLSLVAKKNEARRRYICTQGRLHRWPLGVMDTLRVLKFLFLWKTKSKSVGPQPLETLQSWSDRQWGPEITRSLLGPACLGIFGVPPSRLSARLIYDYFFADRKKEYGQLRGSVAPAAGMGEWGRLLFDSLKKRGVTFVFQSQEGTQSLKEDQHLVLATDIGSAAQILKSLGDPRGEELQKVPAVHLVSVNCFFGSRPPGQKPGFGVLFAREEGLEPLGVLLNSDIFPQRSHSAFSETWIFGSENEELTERSTESFLQSLRATRERIWKDSSAPLDSRVNVWKAAIPLYGLTLESVLAALPPGAPNIHLMGNYLGEIGLNRLFHRAKSLIDNL